MNQPYDLLIVQYEARVGAQLTGGDWARSGDVALPVERMAGRVHTAHGHRSAQVTCGARVREAAAEHGDVNKIDI